MALQEEIEKVQNRAARFATITALKLEIGSMTGILKIKDGSLSRKRGDTVGLYFCTKV